MSAEGKGAAGPPGVGGEEPAEAPPGPGRQVCASAAGVTALTDRTKRLRLRSGQEPAAPDGPGMLQHKVRKAPGPSFTTDEKLKKSMFPLRLTRGKKEKHAPHDKDLSSTGTSRKGIPTSVAKEDGACHTERLQTEVLPAFRPSRDNYSKGEVKPSAVPSPAGSSVDYEEDMYRDAEEIEREKELLVCGAGTSVFSENKLSVAPEVDIMDYCQKEWRGSTSSAKRMRKGYEAVSQRFISIRRVRGDNYCAVRATLFQALSQTLWLPDWLQNKDLMLLPEKLMAKYDWIMEWQKLTGKAENWTEEIKGCLLLLKQKVEMFLLAYSLRHSLHVYRLYKYGTDEFLALYPSCPEEGWPVVTLITEDDRHYNVPVRMCEETSL